MTRTLLRVVDGVGFYLVGLVSMLATGERRQRLGDLAAGTVVVDGTEASKSRAASRREHHGRGARRERLTRRGRCRLPSALPTLEAELFEPEPEFHPELQDEDALDEAALADAGFFGLADPGPEADAEPEPRGR